MSRRAIGEQKRKILLKSMRKRGALKPTEEEKRKIEIRKEYWRRFREKNEKDEEEEEEEDEYEAGKAKQGLTGCIEDATASSSLSSGHSSSQGPSSLGIIGKDIEYPETNCLKNSKLTLKSPKINPISASDPIMSQAISKGDSNERKGDPNGEK